MLIGPVRLNTEQEGPKAQNSDVPENEIDLTLEPCSKKVPTLLLDFESP